MYAIAQSLLQILFDDMYSATLPRKDVYLPSERLPRRAILHRTGSEGHSGGAALAPAAGEAADATEKRGRGRRSRMPSLKQREAIAATK